MSTVACLISCTFLLVVCCFFASVNARTGPAAGSSLAKEMISYLEPTPIHAKLEVAELKIHNIKEMDYVRIAPPETDSIFHFHSKDNNKNNRRGLVGSSPPTCKYKCGSCQPCMPVHVAIGSPHGVISETEYYPEVWRCLCGNSHPTAGCRCQGPQ